MIVRHIDRSFLTFIIAWFLVVRYRISEDSDFSSAYVNAEVKRSQIFDPRKISLLVDPRALNSKTAAAILA